MAEKGVKEQVLAMERLPKKGGTEKLRHKFTYYIHIQALMLSEYMIHMISLFSRFAAITNPKN